MQTVPPRTTPDDMPRPTPLPEDMPPIIPEELPPPDQGDREIPPPMGDPIAPMPPSIA